MNINDKMRSKGLKATPQRRVLYETVCELRHAPIEEIIVKVQLVNPEITVSTIYRILNSFCDHDLLAKVSHPSGKIYYDINLHEHHHIITSDQELIDLNDPELTELIRQRVLDQIGGHSQIDKISIQIMTSKKE